MRLLTLSRPRLLPHAILYEWRRRFESRQKTPYLLISNLEKHCTCRSSLDSLYKGSYAAFFKASIPFINNIDGSVRRRNIAFKNSASYAAVSFGKTWVLTPSFPPAKLPAVTFGTTYSLWVCRGKTKIYHQACLDHWRRYLLGPQLYKAPSYPFHASSKSVILHKSSADQMRNDCFSIFK